MPSQSLDAFLSRLRSLHTKWRKDVRQNPKNKPIQIPGQSGPAYPASIALRTVYTLVEEAEKKLLDANELNVFLEAACNLEHEIIEGEYGSTGPDGLGMIPIACKNIITDGNHIPQGVPSAEYERLVQSMANVGLETDARSVMVNMSRMPLDRYKVYDRASRTSKHTTPLAIFSATRPPLPSDASPELSAFAEARCEISARGSGRLPMSMATTDDVVVVIGAAGWKQRSPTLEIERVDRISPRQAAIASADIYPYAGLANVATQLRLDSTRSLLYMADDSRVKSYSWSFTGTPTSLPVHTLKSDGFGDAMFLRDNGAKVFRSGSRGMAVWDVAGLPTHGPDGKGIVGRRLKGRIESLRNPVEEIEPSSGAPPTQTLSAPPLKNIALAADHPNTSAQVLAVHHAGAARPMTPGVLFPSFGYNVKALDLETQQVASWYVGHSASPNAVATNGADPNAFVTGASDGGVRFYDARLPTPQFAIDHAEEKILAVLYENIGGQPFIIYGGHQTEQIKVWDLRSRKPMYELATGNTAVHKLAWDARRQTLLAATECWYLDRVGDVHDYRDAKIGLHGWEWDWLGAARNNDEESEDGDDDESEDEEERMWPEEAWHSETSFGVAYDAGIHMLFRYEFKPDANPRMFPEYGEVSLSAESQ